MAVNWLKSLNTKLVKVDTSALQQLSQSKVEIMDEIKRNQAQRFNEDETMIKELTSKLAAMKEKLHTETQTVEHKKNELAREKVYVDELEKEKKPLLHEIKQMEGKCNSMKSAKPNLQDQQVLEQGKKKLKLYKELTKIQWDYKATCNHEIKGYVSNKQNYIHHFSYENQEIDEKLIDLLWHEILLSSKSECRGESLQPCFPD